jgi:hypothetical protein
VVHQLRAAVSGDQLLARRDVELSERAVAVLLGGAVDHREAARLPEDLPEAERLAPDLPELPPLLDDQRPADDREDREEQQDELGDGTGAEDELRNAAVDAS